MSSNAAPRTRILLAMSAAVSKRFSKLLVGHDVVVAKDLAHAVTLFQGDGFGMVVIEAYFDDSRMFDLIAKLRADKNHPAVPIVCALAEHGRLSDVFVKGLDHAVKASMANAFLDLASMRDDEEGNARARRVIDYLILIDGDLHGGLNRE